MKAKERIILGARQLVYQHGYNNTSISDILEFTDTGKGQLYYYFDSKQAIGHAVIHSLLEEWQKTLFQDILEAEIEAETALDQMIDWFFTFHQKEETHYGCPVGNLISELSLEDEEARQLLEGFMVEWEDLVDVRLAEQAGTQKNQKTKQHAHRLLSDLQGIALWLKLTQNMTQAEASIDLLKEELGLNKKTRS